MANQEAWLTRLIAGSGTVKTSLLISLPLVAFTISIVGGVYFATTGPQRVKLEERERAKVDAQRASVARSLEIISSDLQFLSHDGQLDGLFDEDGSIRPEAELELSDEFLRFSASQRRYDQIRLIDRGGMETVRVNFNGGEAAVVPHADLQDKGGRYYFADSIRLDRREVYVSPFDLNIENGEIELPLKPMIRIATPVFDERGRKQGVVVLNYLGEHLLRTFAATGPGEGSSSLLLNREGFYLRAADPVNEWGFMYEDRQERTFARHYPDEWKRLLLEESGQFETGAGLFTFSTVRPLYEIQTSRSKSGKAFGVVPEHLSTTAYTWKIVSHTPMHIFYEKIHNLGKWLAGLAALIVVIIGIFSWKLAQTRSRFLASQGEVKRLRGILPICAKCKKIRSDRGSWDQLEAYISDHSDAEFSHGLCPQCFDASMKETDELL